MCIHKWDHATVHDFLIYDEGLSLINKESRAIHDTCRFDGMTKLLITVAPILDCMPKHPSLDPSPYSMACVGKNNVYLLCFSALISHCY